MAALLAAPAAAGERVQRATTTFGEVAYWDEGFGEPTVVLLHGLPTSKELWADVIPGLALDHRVLALDLNNFGDSERVGRALTHDQRAAALDELRATLNLDGFILVAHDLGASVAIDYMDAYAEHVDRLVLVSAPAYPGVEAPRAITRLQGAGVGRLLVRLAPRAHYRQALRDGMVHEERIQESAVERFASRYSGPGGARALSENVAWGTPETTFAHYPETLAALQVPTLILHGSQDPWIPVAHAAQLDRTIADSHLVVVGEAGHYLPLDAPGAVVREIRSFLATPAP